MNSSHFKTASVGVLIEETLHTTATLAAEPPAKDLGAVFEPAGKKVRAAQALVLGARDRAVMAEAVAQNASYHAREAYTDLWMDARKVVGNVATAPLMKTLFPLGLAGAKKLAPEELCEDVKRMLLALAEPGTDARLTAHVRPLRDLVKSFEKPLAALKEARRAEEHASAKWIEAREGWVNARVALFGALTLRFPNKPAYVNNFFRVQAAAKKPRASTKKDAEKKEEKKAEKTAGNAAA